MDVRCDRCQTEYELEDDTVMEGGASVQCTSCGHTFIVSRGGKAATPTPPPAAAEVGSAASWMLTSEEGKTHRFRDSTTLQKWIVERRVGRSDRVCPPGGTWRRLGDMDELRPFFEVVDQADRASAARVARPTQPETPARKAAVVPYASPDDDDDDVLTSGRPSGGARPGVGQGRPGYPNRFDSEITQGLGGRGYEGGRGGDDAADLMFPQRRTGPKVVVGILFLGLVGAAAYFGFNGFGSRGAREAKEGAVASVPVAPPAAEAPRPPAPSAPSAAQAVAPPTNPVSPTPAGPPAATTPRAPSASAAAAPPAPSAPATPPPAAAAASPVDEPGVADNGPAQGRHAPEASRPVARTTPAGGDAPGRSRSYEQLVADGDRALENGNNAKAQKFFDEALKLQPDGVAAVTGSGYLLLDRQKPLAAIGMFKRALASAPSFPQALFGLGEAYRSQGQPAQAIENYRKYLGAAPNGPDAPAAHRQLRELESQSAAATPTRHGAPSPAPDDTTSAPGN